VTPEEARAIYNVAVADAVEVHDVSHDHRIAKEAGAIAIARAAAAEERAAVVAWLRRESKNEKRQPAWWGMASVIADAIERGEHLAALTEDADGSR
jgi:precorrin-2 methylase